MWIIECPRVLKCFETVFFFDISPLFFTEEVKQVIKRGMEPIFLPKFSPFFWKGAGAPPIKCTAPVLFFWPCSTFLRNEGSTPKKKCTAPLLFSAPCSTFFSESLLHFFWKQMKHPQEKGLLHFGFRNTARVKKLWVYAFFLACVQFSNNIDCKTETWVKQFDCLSF